jgi:hypothetical protein
LPTPGLGYWSVTAGIAALADPGTKAEIFTHLLRLTEPPYIKHLCSKLPGNYIAYARMRFEYLYRRTMTFTVKYPAKPGFGLSYFHGTELILIKILIKSKPQFAVYIHLSKFAEHNLAPATPGPGNAILQKKTLDLLHNTLALGHQLVTQPYYLPV